MDIGEHRLRRSASENTVRVWKPCVPRLLRAVSAPALPPRRTARELQRVVKELTRANLSVGVGVGVGVHGKTTYHRQNRHVTYEYLDGVLYVYAKSINGARSPMTCTTIDDRVYMREICSYSVFKGPRFKQDYRKTYSRIWIYEWVNGILDAAASLCAE